MFRSKHCPSSVYESSSSSGKICSPGRDKNYSLSRRLANSGKIIERVEGSKGICIETGGRIGNFSEYGKVSVSSHSEDRLFGNDHRFREFLGFPSSETSRLRFVNDSRICQLREAACSILAKVTGTHVLTREICSRGKVEDEAPAVCPSSVLGQIHSVGEDVDCHPSTSSGGFSLVEQSREIKSRDLFKSQEPRPHLVVRRVSAGLGSHHQWSAVLRTVDGGTESSTYQQFRAEGCLERSQGSGESSLQQGCSSAGRQLDSFVLSSQARGNKILGSLLSGPADLNMGRGEESFPSSSIHKRSKKRDSRQFEQERSDSPHRMDFESASLSTTVEPLGSTECRSFCNLSDSPVTPVYIPSPRRASPGCRCNVAKLVQHGRLCFSSLRHVEAGDQQNKRKSELQNNPSSSVLATERVVSGSDGAPNRLSSEVATQTRPIASTSGQSSAPKPPHSSVDRMETVLRFARANRFSGRVSKRIYTARKGSTNALYQQRWAVFFRWCRSNKCSASRPSINSICEFLIYLKEVKKMATGTIRGYKSMLHTVLRHTGLDVQSNQDISDVIRSFQIEDPEEDKETVFWNLDVVLKYLCSSKFEPISEIALVDLTKKTLFLIFLALAKRISEIQALSSSVGFSSQGAILSLALKFRAKNDFKCKSLPRNFVVRELGSLVGQEEEATICPVRALRTYVDRTKDLRGDNSKRLFVAPRNPRRPASKNAISYLLRMLIREAHASLKPELVPILKVKPHELRAVATSVAFKQNLSLDSVMETAQWRCKLCNSVFASHYLKDISYDFGNCRTLGPFVAAGTVIP